MIASGSALMYISTWRQIASTSIEPSNFRRRRGECLLMRYSSSILFLRPDSSLLARAISASRNASSASLATGARLARACVCSSTSVALASTAAVKRTRLHVVPVPSLCFEVLAKLDFFGCRSS